MDVDTSSVSMKDTKEDVKCLRKLPFSASERELIVALVRDRPIIEDKRTHANNILLKKQAWEALAVAFNAQPYVSQRTSVQLKRCWENIKSQRKKELSQESRSMIATGGGPPQGGSAASSNNIIDIICPSINLTVPGVIDSNSIEISQDLCFSPTSPDNDLKEIIERKKPERARKIPYEQDNEVENTSPFQLKRKFTKEFVNTPTSVKKLESEMDARKKRCTINIQNDQALHELRIQREKILIKRETNLMEYEKEIHELQKKKLKLEIDLLGRINKN